jgi:hypothetical protein
MPFQYFLFVSSWFLLLPMASADGPFDHNNHKMGLALDHWKYQEPGLMEDVGFLSGLEYEFRTTLRELFYLQTNAELLLGTTKYTGSDLNNGTPLQFDQTNIVGMVQVYAGVALPIGGLYIIPKAGLLFRKLVDLNDAFPGDYQRDQDYLTQPLGLDILIPLDSGHLTFSALIMESFKGKNKTYLTNVNGDRDLTLRQDEGKGRQYSITYFHATAPVPWYASVVLRSWKVEGSESKVATVPGLGTLPFYEPANETLAVGVRFGISL